MSDNKLDVKDHAQEIIQTHYDGQSGAGYVKFCNCRNGKTTNLMDETTHCMLTDWDESGSHVIGLEILNFPVANFMRGTLGSDLTLTELSEQQKTAVLEKFLS